MVIGLDLGTSGVKAVLLDRDGAVRASASRPLTVSRPRPRWSEQAPRDWWDAARSKRSSPTRVRPASTRARFARSA